MIRTDTGKAVGMDDIPEEIGESSRECLTTLYNRTMACKRMPEEWRDSVLIPIEGLV